MSPMNQPDRSNTDDANNPFLDPKDAAIFKPYTHDTPLHQANRDYHDRHIHAENALMAEGIQVHINPPSSAIRDHLEAARKSLRERVPESKLADTAAWHLCEVVDGILHYLEVLADPPLIHEPPKYRKPERQR